MGLNLKSMLSGKKGGNSGDATQVKKNIQTSDSIISQAVANAGNISNLTLSKDEQEKMLENRNKIPFKTLALKYLSLILLAITIVSGLLLKADLAPRNQYLGTLGLDENNGSQFIKYSQEKNILTKKNTQLTEEVSSLEERIKSFEDTPDNQKIALLVPEVEEVNAQQKRWFSETVEEENPLDGSLFEVRKFGLIDSFSEMVDYFEDKNYQPRFFNQKNRDESLNRSEPSVCNIANNKLTSNELALKQQYENAGRCFSSSILIMANEIEIRGLNINANGANVTVAVSDLLSRVFTGGSEFVAMMNSFSFYKGAEVNNFTRRELSEGGDSTEIALRLDFQAEDEEDEFDQYLIDLVEWQKNWKR